MRRVTEALLPLAKAHRARIINMSSVMGTLTKDYSAAVRKRLSSAAVTLADVDGAADDFVATVRSGGSLTAAGYRESCYAMSKVLLNAYTVNLSATLGDSVQFVVSMCPGWCHTRMGGKTVSPSPPRSLCLNCRSHPKLS